MTATQFDTATDATFLDAFLASGDVGNLLPLADYADETDRPEVAECVRRILRFAPVYAEPVRFFVRHAGYSYGVDGPAAGRLAGALALAQAELWFADLEDEGRGQVRWVEDPDADRSWMSEDDGPDAPAWGCIVELLDGGRPTGEGESLWGIFLASTHPYEADPYARVVEAELKAEVRRRY